MKKIILGLCLLSSLAFSQGEWVTGYYVAWDQLDLPLSVLFSNPSYAAFTHIVMFGPDVSHTNMNSGDSWTVGNINAMVDSAHTHGKKVLWCHVGDEGSWQTHINSTNRIAYITLILNWMQTYNLDGFDFDIEPMSASGKANFQAFIPMLRDSANARGLTSMLFTTYAAPDYAGYFEDSIWTYMDQINFQSYDLSGSWDEEVMYQGQLHNPHEPTIHPGYHWSIDQALETFDASSIPRSKLGIGSKWNGMDWDQATRLLQLLTTPTVTVGLTDIYFSTLVTSYPTAYANAESLNVEWGGTSYYQDLTGTANDHWFSFDGPKAQYERVAYMRINGLGGYFVWQLTGGYLTGSPPDKSPQATALTAAIDSINAGAATTVLRAPFRKR